MLKPIKQMTDDERRAEVEQRLRIGVNEPHEIITCMLLYLRAAKIGDDRIAPPEPEWRRKRDPKDELPEDLARIEFEMFNDYGMRVGLFVKDFTDFKFVTNSSGYMANSVKSWRYREEPRRWVCIAEEGNPDKLEMYYVRFQDHKEGLGVLWYSLDTGEREWKSIHGNRINPTHWQRIAPPTPFEEANP